MRPGPRTTTASLVIAWLLAGCGGTVNVTPAAGGVTPQIQTGRADAGEIGISITTNDWTYGVPSDGVTWVDEAGTVHDSGRPACLQPGMSRSVRFAAVEVTVQGSTWRPVVWISCR
jgi:hypothetical protein